MFALLLACSTGGSDSQELLPEPPHMEVESSPEIATIFLGGQHWMSRDVANHGGLVLEVRVAALTDDGGTESLNTFNVEPFEIHTAMGVFIPEELGLYHRTIRFASNDPDNPEVDVPVSLEVLPRE